jgi:hypothetical protein
LIYLQQKYLTQVGGGVSPLLWGSVLGAVGYAVGNKNDFHTDAFLIAALGSGITGSLAFLGGTGMILQVINVALTTEMVNYLQQQH